MYFRYTKIEKFSERGGYVSFIFGVLTTFYTIYEQSNHPTPQSQT